MGLLFRFAELLLLLIPLSAAIYAAVRVFRSADGGSGQSIWQRMGVVEQQGVEDRSTAALNQEAHRRELERLIDQHNATDARWLEYEIDAAKLLEFPMMTDMRNPATVAFHKAKLRADLLRPDRIDDILFDRDAQLDYREAVHEYMTAFAVAEAEATRRRRRDFSDAEQQRFSRAQHLLSLAADGAATPQERLHAYERACKELEGLIVLPAATRASIERRISGEIDG